MVAADKLIIVYVLSVYIFILVSHCCSTLFHHQFNSAVLHTRWKNFKNSFYKALRGNWLFLLGDIKKKPTREKKCHMEFWRPFNSAVWRQQTTHSIIVVQFRQDLNQRQWWLIVLNDPATPPRGHDFDIYLHILAVGAWRKAILIRV